jgi:hypothetical protein
MSQQISVNRGSELRRVAFGLLSAGVLLVTTACSVAPPPAPAVAPALKVAGAPTIDKGAVVERQHSLKTFRYTNQPVLTTPRASLARPLEFYRYTGMPASAATHSTRSLEMFRYTPAPTDASVTQNSQYPLEFFRYATQPR